MSVIFSRAPLRLPLGGGGTDLPSYSDVRGGFIVAAAIDKYVYMLTHTAFQQRFRMKYAEIEVVDDVAEIRHPVLRETLRMHWHGDPIEIASVANVPAGTGLGSSGAFTVCLIKNLACARRITMPPEQLARLACEIEIDVLHEPVGKQDQYVAAYGGIAAYTFHEDGRVQIDPLEIDATTLQDMRSNLLLFYTGEARSASAVLKDQDDRSKVGDEAVFANLDHIKEIAYEIRDVLLRGDLVSYAKLLHEHWEEKRRRSSGISTERVDELYELALDNGAIGGKLVGAGGGGFLLVYSEHPERTRRAMREAQSQELDFGFDFSGAYAAANA